MPWDGGLLLVTTALDRGALSFWNREQQAGKRVQEDEGTEDVGSLRFC